MSILLLLIKWQVLFAVPAPPDLLRGSLREPAYQRLLLEDFARFIKLRPLL